MPLLLLLPLLLLVLLALWLVLLPLSLWQRYRYGRARRRARGWALAVNAWGLLVSVALFLLVSALSLFWWPDNLWHAGLGLAAGALLGALGVRLTRFEPTPQGVYYQPNGGLALVLTVVVAARIGMGFVQLFRHWQDGAAQAASILGGHGSLVAVAGLLLGHYLVYAWGVKRRAAIYRAPL